MAPEAPDDSDQFYSFVWLLVREVFEEPYLHLVPAGGVDGLPTGDRRYGPWDPARCSEVLVRWHELGLVELYESTVANASTPAFAPADAASVLRDPARWCAGPSLTVCPTDALLDEPDPWQALHDAAPAL